MHSLPTRAKVAFLVLLAFSAALFAAYPAEARWRNSPDFKLTILHNNDGESQLLNAGSGLEEFGGVARFKTLVDDLRRDAKRGAGKQGVVMLSSGDNFLAGPEFNASLDKGVPFYDSEAMKLIGYDAVAIGNHEFDFGPDVLADFICGTLDSHRKSRNGDCHGRADFPFVSANLDFSDEPRLRALERDDVIVDSYVINESGQKIGIVGATTPLLPFISSPRNVEVDPEVAEAIQKQVDRLTRKGVKIIIMISHLQSVNEDLDLAGMIEDVDVMIAGGGDELLANEGDLLVPGDVLDPALPYPLYATDADGDQVPVVTTAGNYKYVGRLIVEFDKQGNVMEVDTESGPVRVASKAYEDGVKEDRTMLRKVTEPVAAYLNDLATTQIATSEVDLDGIRGNVRTQETNEGNLMADALLWQAGQLASTFGVDTPTVAFQNGGGIRNDSIVSAGPISQLVTFDIAPFSNFVSVVEDVSPEDLKAILENAVSNVENVDGRFAQIAGLSFTYDPSAPAGARVIDVILDDGPTPIIDNGSVVSGAPSVDVATIDFLANGGDQYPFSGVFTTLGVSYQQALENYLVDGLGGVVTAVGYPVGGEGRISTGAFD